MKVLQVNVCCNLSTGKIACDLIDILRKHGHDGILAYGRGLPNPQIDTLKIGTDFDHNLHGLYTRITDRHGFASTKAAKSFIKEVEMYDPDIIHLHNLPGYYINVEVLFQYLSKAGKPVVWTLHDCWPFTGHCCYFDQAGCEKWKTGCEKCPQKKSYPQSYFLDGSKRNYHKKKELFTSVPNMTIVTPSKWLAGLTEQSYLNSYEIHVIPNGIDLAIFKPVQSDFVKKHHLQGKFIILGVANGFGERKGFRYFVELARRIDQDCKIVLVGADEKERFETDKILFLNRTNQMDELAEIYTAADVFVNPTMEEVLGMTNVEALACGTPVITFDTGGSVECIDSSCGIVVEKGNMDELFRCVMQLKNRNFDSKVCLERSERFDKNARYMDYIDIYQRMLGEPV